MQITSRQNTKSLHRPSPKVETPADTTLASDNGDSAIIGGLKTAAGVAVPLIPLAAGGTAAYHASSLFHLGKDSVGLYSVLGGGIVGGVVGGVAGGVLSHLYSKHSSDDAAGKGMMSGMLTIGGAVGGLAVGTIGAFTGANPLVTVPAAIAATAATAGAMGFVADKLFD